jgi:vesicle-associated membrane protein 7
MTIVKHGLNYSSYSWSLRRYALISRGKTVLAEFTDQAGNFPTVTRLLLGKIDDSKPGRVSYVYDQYMFHYAVYDNIIYLCMTDADPSGADRVRLPYAFLDDIKVEFVRIYGDRSQVEIFQLFTYCILLL